VRQKVKLKGYEERKENKNKEGGKERDMSITLNEAGGGSKMDVG